MRERMLTRYLVRVPVGVDLEDAVTEHRARTGYGGAIVIKFERKPSRVHHLVAPRAAG
jgi:hypothetical protein